METKLESSQILTLCSTVESFEQNSHATVPLIARGTIHEVKKRVRQTFFKKMTT
jgi:hypothetical protein